MPTSFPPVPAEAADFLARLNQEAALQAKIHHHRLLPSQLDVFTSALGRYPWQLLLVVSGVTALLVTTWPS